MSIRRIIIYVFSSATSKHSILLVPKRTLPSSSPSQWSSCRSGPWNRPRIRSPRHPGIILLRRCRPWLEPPPLSAMVLAHCHRLHHRRRGMAWPRTCRLEQLSVPIYDDLIPPLAADSLDTRHLRLMSHPLRSTPVPRRIALRGSLLHIVTEILTFVQNVNYLYYIC